jgi:putative SOS response-associated peptidase YedK
MPAREAVSVARGAVGSSAMCGRYAITLPPEAVRAYFAYRETPNFPPRYNIAPTQPIPVVIAEPRSAGGVRHFQLMRWGFLPGFVKDPKGFPLIINARAETMADRPSYRAALQRRRCLVIADGFYEWRKGSASGGRGEVSRPYLIRRVSGEPMGFAGLYETWCDRTGGEIDTACIITTSANSLAALVHDRMPAILDPGEFVPWLDVEGVGAAKALALLKPAPDAALELVEIGPAVNRVANDDESLQQPIAPPIPRAGGSETLLDLASPLAQNPS